MKAFVFTDESLRAEAGRFVWLAIDTEKEQNAAVQVKYPDRRLADAARGRPEGRARRPAVGRRGDGRAAQEAPGRRPHRRDRRRGRGGDADAAFAARGEALRRRATSPPPPRPTRRRCGWPRRTGRGTRAPSSRCCSRCPRRTIARRRSRSRAARCPRLRETPSVLTIAGTGLDCALQAPATDPARADTIAFFEKAAREAIANPKVRRRRRRSLRALRRPRRGAQGREGRGRRPEDRRGVGALPRRRGRPREEPRGPHRLRLPSPRRLHGDGRAAARDPHAGGVRARLPEGLQPARPPGRRLQGA